MKKFIIRSMFFIGILLIIVFTSMSFINKKARELAGPNYEEQIDAAFNDILKENYETIILGNSRMYRGINPYKLDTKAYNFAHDNDSFNQIYYKLLYLQRNHNLSKEIIIGVDYFQFSVFSDTRNHSYKKYFHKDYMKDYDFDLNNSFNSYIIFTQNRINLLLDWVQGLNEFNLDEVPFMTDRGQYIRYGRAVETDRLKRKRDSTILPIQEEYFNKILDFCNENSIKVCMVMMPIRDVELQSYTEEIINEFDEYFKNKENENVYYMNFGKDDRFTMIDFQDVTHLNKDGADKFSEIFKATY